MGFPTCFCFSKSQKPIKEPKSHQSFYLKAAFTIVQFQKHLTPYFHWLLRTKITHHATGYDREITIRFSFLFRSTPPSRRDSPRAPRGPRLRLRFASPPPVRRPTGRRPTVRRPTGLQLRTPPDRKTAVGRRPPQPPPDGKTAAGRRPP